MSIPIMIIPYINRIDLLEITLSTIDYPVEEILIINNSRQNNILDFLKERFNNLNLRILDLPSNLGCAGSWNLGIKLYPHAPFWFISSTDIHFKPGGIEDAMQKVSHGTLMQLRGYSSFILGEEFVRMVGLFDEYLYPAYYEDTDYHDRVLNAGLADRVFGGHDGYPRCTNQCELWSPDSQWTYGPGPTTTLNSDQNFARINSSIAWQSNENYYNDKRSRNDWGNGFWNIDRRRQNEFFR